MQRFGLHLNVAPARTTQRSEPLADATANTDGSRFPDSTGTVRSPDRPGSSVPRPTSATGEGVEDQGGVGAGIAVLVFELLVYVRSPTEFVSESDFYDGAFEKVPQILVFKDIARADFNPAMQLGER
jgi:hypothetical protein